MNLNALSVEEKRGAGTAIRRLNRGVLLWVAGAFGGAVPGLAQTQGAAVSVAETIGPKIEFAGPIFDFGRVKQGDVVRHDFIFKNTGTAVLEITGVAPGCGCTTAGDWAKRVEPGQTGIIPLQVNSAGFSGAVNKSTTVTSNDPSQPTINLQIKGDVWTPFAVTPTMAVFTVTAEADASQSRVIRIVNQTEEPVAFSGVEGANSTIQAELIAVKPGKEFELKITAAPPFPANSITAPLTLKTSSAATPTISVLAQLIVQPAVVAAPERITLPAGPLPLSNNYLVMVRNHGKSALVLSDATINVPGAVAKVQEVQAAKLFQVTVKFPAGYELRPAEIVGVSIKSNHPKFAVLRVPVVTTPRPAVPAKVTAVTPAPDATLKK